MEDIRSYFVRRVPNTPEYEVRLEREINIVNKLNATQFFIEVSRVCKATSGIPRTIRGSAGSSILTWALGINDLDPVSWGIPFERFINGFRKDLPDIDIDFAHDDREKAFSILENLYPGRVGRVVNHVQYQEKSAIREALRIAGYKKRIPANFNVSELVPGDEDTVYEIASNLKDTVRSLDLHCGGAIIFQDKIPVELRVPGTDNQIRYDKREVEKNKLWKLDMLSNRALSQLRDCGITDPDVVDPEDKCVSELLSRGDSFGLTQAESPAFKKILRAIRPRNVRELALCMGLVRPAAAWRGHRAMFVENWNKTRENHHLVFEDDANSAISLLAGVSLEEADTIRRAFSKQDHEGIKEFRKKFNAKPETAAIVSDLESFKDFSMCESHAVSYAKITWALAYAKSRDPKTFWHSTLNNAISMYRPWVHIREAVNVGLNVCSGKRPWKRCGDVVYSEGYTPSLFPEVPSDEFKTRGYWTSSEYLKGCRKTIGDQEEVSIRGPIAINRIVKYGSCPTTFATAGTDNGSYIDLVLDGAYDLSRVSIIECSGTFNSDYGSEWVDVRQIY